MSQHVFLTLRSSPPWAWVSLLGVLLGLLCSCDADRQLLWQAQGGQGQAGGGSSGSSGEGGVIEPPPPPPPFECHAPPAEPCLCPQEKVCVCGGPEPEPCGARCDIGFCQMRCVAESTCELTCTHGCDVVCESGTLCTVGCSEGCSVVCEPGAHCVVWSWNEPTQVFCDVGAICECPFEGGCICFGPGCPQPPPPDEPPEKP